MGNSKGMPSGQSILSNVVPIVIENGNFRSLLERVLPLLNKVDPTHTAITFSLQEQLLARTLEEEIREALHK